MREMIKTAIENKQNLVMSDKYIEDRLDDEGLTIG